MYALQLIWRSTVIDTMKLSKNVVCFHQITSNYTICCTQSDNDRVLVTIKKQGTVVMTQEHVSQYPVDTVEATSNTCSTNPTAHKPHMGNHVQSNTPIKTKVLIPQTSLPYGYHKCTKVAHATIQSPPSLLYHVPKLPVWNKEQSHENDFKCWTFLPNLTFH